MDLFKYKDAIKEIETCPTISKLEELIRSCRGKLMKTDLVRIYRNTCSSTPQSDILYYKLLTFGLKEFSRRSSRKLPEFIHKDKSLAHECLLISIFDSGATEGSFKKTIEFTEPPTYEQFMDWFEFDDLMDVPFSSIYLEKFNQIIGDKPVHFKVKFNYTKTRFDNYSTNLRTSTQTLIYAIRHKQVNFPDKPQTIWDMFIEDCKIDATPSDVYLVEEQVTKLKQQISALEALGDYIGTTGD